MEKMDKDVFVNLDTNGAVNKHNALRNNLIVLIIEELNKKLVFVLVYQEFLCFYDFHFKFLIIVEESRFSHNYKNNHFLNNMKYLK